MAHMQVLRGVHLLPAAVAAAVAIRWLQAADAGSATATAAGSRCRQQLRRRKRCRAHCTACCRPAQPAVLMLPHFPPPHHNCHCRGLPGAWPGREAGGRLPPGCCQSRHTRGAPALQAARTAGRRGARRQRRRRAGQPAADAHGRVRADGAGRRAGAVPVQRALERQQGGEAEQHQQHQLAAAAGDSERVLERAGVLAGAGCLLAACTLDSSACSTTRLLKQHPDAPLCCALHAVPHRALRCLPAGLPTTR